MDPISHIGGGSHCRGVVSAILLKLEFYIDIRMCVCGGGEITCKDGMHGDASPIKEAQVLVAKKGKQIKIIIWLRFKFI